MKPTAFSALFVVLISLFASACGDESNAKPVSLDGFYSERAKCDSLGAEILSGLRLRSVDTSANLDTSMMMIVLEDEMKLALYHIDQMLRDYARNATGTVVPDTGNFDPVISDPDDIDKATWYFVGEKPETPTGKGLELYDALARFGDELHDDVPFFIGNDHTAEQREQWVKDSFYHATTADVLVRLTLFRLNVLQAMKYSMDKGLYKEMK